MAKVITFGEIMLRLSPSGFYRFVQADSYDAVYGGGEANVAVSLSAFGDESYYVTKLPEHEIGEGAVRSLLAHGIKTDYITRGGNRIGIYFCENGSSVRPSKVIYDRANSAIATASESDFDFKAIMTGKDWFHFSGITPAISESAAKLTRIAAETAKQCGLKVSCDLNYRKKLWTPEKAQSVMVPLMEFVDVCISNEEDIQMSLGFKPEADVEKGQTDAKGYENTLKQLKQRFGFELIACTLRESYSASKNGWKAIVYDGQDFLQSKHYTIEPIVDRVGSGDSFAAGLIHGLTNGMSKQEALEFAVAASALKHTVHGDFNCVNKSEVLSLMKGNASGRVQR